MHFVAENRDDYKRGTRKLLAKRKRDRLIRLKSSKC